MTISTEGTLVFAEAAEWVCTVVSSVPEDRWDGPGLDAWNLRALVGHTSRAFVTVNAALQAPATNIDVSSPQGYFGRVAALPAADSDSVRERGVTAGAALGAHPSAAFRALAKEAIAATQAAGNPMITTIAGGMTLQAYLPTRTFELVVHGIDICAALGRHPDPPLSALRAALLLSAELAAQNAVGVDLLLAATGRSALPSGFSVLKAALSAPEGH